MTGKRAILLLVLVPAGLLLVSSSRTWVTGRTRDAVLAQTNVVASGSQLAPGAVALGAVALASLVALLTGGQRIRRVSSVILLLAALGATTLVVGVLRDPSAALGRRAAELLGRTGSVPTDGSATAWALVAAGCAVVLCGASVLALVAVGRWDGLSSRFDRPSPRPGSQARALRSSAWEQLSDGRDPTVQAGTTAEVDNEQTPRG